MFNCKNPFYSANMYYKEIFGEKIIKLAIDGGFTCPNRDGLLSRGGCVFCSESGSGDFAGSRNLNIKKQYEQMKEVMAKKWDNGKYMMYFQAYTNTYAPIERLRKLYYEAISQEGVVALSIATRPDCLGEDVIELLEEISKKVYVCVELGFQTSKEESVKFINRCYENEVYKKAVKRLRKSGIDVITHIILGLPNESYEDMLERVKYAIKSGTKGLKLQLLHIIKNTRLYDYYKENEFKVFSYEEYIKVIVSLIENIPQDVVIHRITGDGKKENLFMPLWSLDKRRVLNGIAKEFINQNTYQGKKIQPWKVGF